MKKLIAFFFILVLVQTGQAQVSKTVNIITAGTLSTVLTSGDLYFVTNLTITGTIDARDFKTMRDAMPALAILDLSGVTIAGYSGTAGPAGVKATVSNAKNTAPEPIFDNSLSKPHTQQVPLLAKATVTAAYPANEIPQYAFYDSNNGKTKDNLKSVIMPLSVTSIGDKAFSFSGLTSITIPSLVTSIGSSAFGGCIGLTSVTIPSSVISIGSNAFVFCRGLTSIIIPPSVTIIGNYAFNSCTGLTTVTIPSSVISIGDNAFNGCTALNTVTIPSSVTTMGIGAFDGKCLITVDAGNLNYSSQDGVLYNKTKTQLIQCITSKVGIFTIPMSVTSIANAAFFGCNSLSTVNIPSSVTTIGSLAFYNCNGLLSITIPSSVTSIGSHAFSGCSGLTSIYVYRALPLDLTSSTDVFYGVNKSTCTLYVPQGSKAAYLTANQWKDFINIAEMTTAVHTADDVKVNLYPNPTTESFHVDGFEGKASLKLIALNGKVVLAKQVTGNETISVSNLPKGVYIVKIVTNGGIVERKLVKN